MNKARLIITALHTENLTQHEVATRYGVSQSWVSKLVAHYKKEGEAAFYPKSRRPHTSTTKLTNEPTQLILTLRKQLSEKGHDAGAHTIAWLDDHSRLALHVSAHHRMTAKIVLHTFQETTAN